VAAAPQAPPYGPKATRLTTPLPWTQPRGHHTRERSRAAWPSRTSARFLRRRSSRKRQVVAPVSVSISRSSCSSRRCSTTSKCAPTLRPRAPCAWWSSQRPLLGRVEGAGERRRAQDAGQLVIAGPSIGELGSAIGVRFDVGTQPASIVEGLGHQVVDRIHGTHVDREAVVEIAEQSVHHHVLSVSGVGDGRHTLASPIRVRRPRR